MTKIIDEKSETELELRLLLDAAMRHQQEKYNNDLTVTERGLIEAYKERDLALGENVYYYDVVEEALRARFVDVLGDLFKLLDGDALAVHAVVDHLCTRGPSKRERFRFMDQTGIGVTCA